MNAVRYYENLIVQWNLRDKRLEERKKEEETEIGFLINEAFEILQFEIWD